MPHKHIRNYDVTILGAHPGDYYWKCEVCGKHFIDSIGGTIVKDPDLIKWEYKNLKGLTRVIA